MRNFPVQTIFFLINAPLQTFFYFNLFYSAIFFSAKNI